MVTATFRPDCRNWTTTQDIKTILSSWAVLQRTSIPKLIIGESYREDLANGSVGEMAPAISGVPDRSTAHNLFKALAGFTKEENHTRHDKVQTFMRRDFFCNLSSRKHQSGLS